MLLESLDKKLLFLYLECLVNQRRLRQKPYEYFKSFLEEKVPSFVGYFTLHVFSCHIKQNLFSLERNEGKIYFQKERIFKTPFLVLFNRGLDYIFLEFIVIVMVWVYPQRDLT